MASPIRDPMTDKDLSPHFLAVSGILMLCSLWALWDEVITRRPWKRYQVEWKEIATAKYEGDLAAARQRFDKEVSQSEAYKAALAAHEAAEKAYKPQEEKLRKLKAEFHKVDRELGLARKRVQDVRGEYAATNYTWERTERETRAFEQLSEKKAELDRKVAEVEPEVARLDERKEALKREIQSDEQPLADAAAALAPFRKEIEDAQKGLAAVAAEKVEIKQIHSVELGVVDRCHSCHLSIDKPGFAMKDAEGKGFDPPFASHPGRGAKGGETDLLAIHHPERFGCTSCHLGQGSAVNSVRQAHGREPATGAPIPFWLTPMLVWAPRPVKFKLDPETRSFTHEAAPEIDRAARQTLAQASCVKCHEGQHRELPGGAVVSKGRALVEAVGCWGCHKIKGFEQTEAEMEQARREVIDLDAAARAAQAKVDAAGDDAEPVDIERAARAKKDLEAKKALAADLEREKKHIGPPLTKLREKVFGEWIPYWIEDPKRYRPRTRMPTPLQWKGEHAAWNAEHALAIAAYLWQTSEPAPAWTDAKPKGAEADPDLIGRGQYLLKTKGCYACHYDGDFQGDNEWMLREGRDFGPDLSRAGEKVRYGFLVEWILEPKKIHKTTLMPNLRIERAEAEAMAAYLATRKGDESWRATYQAKLPQLEDPAQKDKGKELIQHYGCFACHDIAGLTGLGKPGTELSQHGSKPMERFDFGLVHHDVEESREAFIWLKVREPKIYDHGRFQRNWKDYLKMPKFGFSDAEARAIATFIVGQVEEEVPQAYRYRPGVRKKDELRGEHLVAKFNCNACHVIEGKGGDFREHLASHVLDKKNAKWNPAFADVTEKEEALSFAPPLLNGEGEKAKPNYLFQFLKAPETLRPWMLAKMPTFDMSDREAAALTAYFSAVRGEQFPFIEGRIEIAAKKAADGKALFEKMQCSKCHIPFASPDRKPQDLAPDLSRASRRLKREWVERWLADPQVIQYGTKMPKFPLTPVQIDAIAEYLYSLGEKPAQ